MGKNQGDHSRPLLRRLILAILSSSCLCEDCKIERKHIHLAVGPDPSTSMTISFASTSSCCDPYSSYDDCDFSPIGSVLIGTSPHDMNQVVTESHSPKQYSAQYVDEAWYTSPFLHHITVNGLKPSTTYFYHCIVMDSSSPSTDVNSEDDDKGERSTNGLRHHAFLKERKIFSFKTAPLPGNFPKRPVTLAFVADIGRTNAAATNFAHMTAHNSDIDVLMFAGDLAYSRLRHHRWDTFFDTMDNYDMFSELPLMVAPGNHDVDRHPMTGAMYVAYENRFLMPQIQPVESKLDTTMNVTFMDYDIPYPIDYDYGNGYYAFPYGPSLNIVLCSYSSIDPGSHQYVWLETELASIDRTLTPWVTVTMHSPHYNTFFDHHTDPQNIAIKTHLEPLLVEYSVNFVFSGHVHGYQRTWPVAYDILHPKGPVYIIGGNGGCSVTKEFLSKVPEDWVASRDGTHYGYGTLSFLNHTHAHWKRISVLYEEDSYNTVAGMEDVILPPKPKDATHIWNQFFLE